MFSSLHIVICWEKQALIGVYTDKEEAIEIANAYAGFHKCEVNIQTYDIDLRNPPGILPISMGRWKAGTFVFFMI